MAQGIAFIAKAVLVRYTNLHWNLVLGRVDTVTYVIDTKVHLLGVAYTELICHNFNGMV